MARADRTQPGFVRVLLRGTMFVCREELDAIRPSDSRRVGWLACWACTVFVVFAVDGVHGAAGRAFLITREVGGPGGSGVVGGRGKQKTENRGGPGAQPSESVPVEKKNRILITKLA